MAASGRSTPPQAAAATVGGVDLGTLFIRSNEISSHLDWSCGPRQATPGPAGRHRHTVFESDLQQLGNLFGVAGGGIGRLLQRPKLFVVCVVLGLRRRSASGVPDDFQSRAVISLIGGSLCNAALRARPRLFIAAGAGKSSWLALSGTVRYCAPHCTFHRSGKA